MSAHVFNRGADQEKLAFSLWASNKDIVFRHTGQCFGFTSFMFGSTDNDQAVIVMSNGENTQDLFDHIQRAVAKEYKWDYFRPSFYEPVAINSTQLKHYTGEFNWERNFILITQEHHDLFVLINSDRYKLIPIAEDQFLIPGRSLKLIFSKEANKPLEIWKANGDSSQANKLN